MKISTFFYILIISILGIIPINAQQVTIGTGTSSWYYSPITRLFENGASENNLRQLRNSELQVQSIL